MAAPVQEPSAPKLVTSLPPASVRSSGVVSRGVRPAVLLVDPDHEARRELAAELAASFEVHEASDGVTALGIAQAIRPALVISELALDGLDGPTLARGIKSRPALLHTTIVFLSAESSPREVARAVTAGARRHIMKPCAPKKVAEVVARLVSV